MGSNLLLKKMPLLRAFSSFFKRLRTSPIVPSTFDHTKKEETGESLNEKITILG